MELVINASNWLPNLSRSFSTLSYVHQSDYFRAHVLGERRKLRFYKKRAQLSALYGGMYVDIDTIGLSSIEWFDLLKDYDGVNGQWTLENEPLTIGVVGPWRAGCDLAVEWSRQQDEVLNKVADKLLEHMSSPKAHSYPLDWSSLGGNSILTYANKVLPNDRYYSYNGTATTTQWTTMPHHGPLFNISSSDWSLNFTQTPLLVYLHAQIGRYLDNIPVNALVEMPILIVELLAQGAQQCMNDWTESKSLSLHSNSPLASRNRTVISWLKKQM